MKLLNKMRKESRNIPALFFYSRLTYFTKEHIIL